MTLITDILDYDALQDEIKAGYVTEKFHPEFPELVILNYTDRCQFDQHWNAVTRQTRGLIYNRDDMNVVARAFPKFYNYGDIANTGQIDPSRHVMGAWDKIDGSLGIQYETPDGKQAIATRGSFTSEQARHATAWLRANRWDVQEAACGYTWLWEIIYPENRIVLDYGDRDELVYLGVMFHDTGGFLPGLTVHGEIGAAEVLAEDVTFAEVLSLPPRPNAEGMVVWFNQYTAVKLKQADYVALHRIVSNLTVKEVWRQLRAGTFNEFAAALPDEFHQWARDTAERLRGEDYGTVHTDAEFWFHTLNEQELATRKEQAIWVSSNVPADRRGLVFSLLDGKDISDAVWRMVEPKGTQPMRALEEVS